MCRRASTRTREVLHDGRDTRHGEEHVRSRRTTRRSEQLRSRPKRNIRGKQKW